MNDTYDNNGLNDLQSVLRMNSQRWSSTQFKALKGKANKFLNERDVALPIIKGQDFFALCNNDVLTNPDCIDFSSLTAKQKTFISIVHASAQYIRELYICRNTTIPTIYRCAYYFDALEDISRLQVLRDSFSGNDPNKPFNIASRNKFSSKFFNYSTRPSLEDVFNQLTQIKLSFRYLVELFYYYFGILKNFPLDRRISDILIQIVTEEDYERFHGLIKEWDELVVYQMSIMIDIIYPLLHYFESHITDYENILSCINKDLTSKEYFLELSPIRVIINFLIIYIFKNNVQQYLADFELNSYNTFFNNKTTRFEVLFYSWIDSEIELLSDYFLNNLDYNLPDRIATEILSYTDAKRNDEGIADEDKGQQVQQQDLGSGDETGNPPEDNPKRHLSVGHDVEVIKKLATYLVMGFTNTRGSLPALVSSNDEKNITINKLVFLFTGNKDYSFDGQYSLTWNAEQVYLKLLIKLLHNLNELATASHAVFEGRSDYISDKYIKCRLRGGVWPKVAEAFENIKSEATIRNADYRKNYKDTTAPINQKRLRDMKVIADLWLKCKNDMDF